MQPFLQSHCVDCHDGVNAEAGLDLSETSTDLSDLESSRKWILIHDRIVAGEMPPKGEPRPPKLAQSVAVRLIAQAVITAERTRSDVVLRRLNRNEYENTVRDLFGTYVRVKEQLPKDTPTAGFDNVGEGLAVSAEAAQALSLIHI